MLHAAHRLTTCYGSVDETDKRVVPVSPMENSVMRSVAWRRGGIHPDDRIRLYVNPHADTAGSDYKTIKDDGDFHGPTTQYRALLVPIKQYEAKSKCEATKYMIVDYIATRRDIEVDLERTFPGEKCWINTKKGQASLKSVLLAYSATQNYRRSHNC